MHSGRKLHSRRSIIHAKTMHGKQHQCLAHELVPDVA